LPIRFFCTVGVSPSFVLRVAKMSPCSTALSPQPVSPSPDAFRDLAQRGNVVPVYAQLAADFETPLSAYMKISGNGEAFLFESAEITGDNGRYSILGSNPRATIKANGQELPIQTEQNKNMDCRTRCTRRARTADG